MIEPALLEFEDIAIQMPWGGYVAGRWYGDRDERPILAIHGWQDNLGTWDRLIPLLPRHTGVLCIDLPGHGRSSKYPKGMIYHNIDHVHVIKRVIDEYNWDKVSLMGHSLGSTICYMYAALYPHTVDMLIQIDAIMPPEKSSDYKLNEMATRIEKNLIENERMDLQGFVEPPTHTYEQWEQKMYKGSGGSLDLQNCKHLLNRGITQSRQYPQKYFISRDGRVKHYVGVPIDYELYLAMANRMKSINHLVIKAANSEFVNDDIKFLTDFFQNNNSNFELHAIDGNHHVHLNRPTEVANVVIPFILKCRPDNLSSEDISRSRRRRRRRRRRNCCMCRCKL